MRRLMMYTPVVSDSKYLTITALEDGCTVKLNKTYQYSFDESTWQSGSSSKTITLPNGNNLYLKGSLTPVYNSGVGTFTISSYCALSGNCLSLIYGDNADEAMSVPNYGFTNLFQNCTAIKSVSKNFLPAISVGERGYQNLFNGCSNLENTPDLPATTLNNYSYTGMFVGCSSLISAPELPATKIGNSTYYGMFRNCSSLINAPSTIPVETITGKDSMMYMFHNCINLIKSPTLPLKKLYQTCYQGMFKGCSNLREITMLATDISATSCLNDWVGEVAESGTFYKNKDATWNISGNSGVPSGWDIITV